LVAAWTEQPTPGGTFLIHAFALRL